MVNRVNDGQYTNAYINTQRSRMKTDEDAPAFLLNYDEKGVVWDREENDKEKLERQSKADKAKDQKPKSVEPKKDTFESTIKTASDETKTPAFENPLSFDSIVGAIKNLVKSTRYVFSELFKLIWYGNENAEAKDNNTESSDNKESAVTKGSEKIENTKEIPAKPRLTEYEKKVMEAKKGVNGVPARNTNLLTTYNKFGKTTNPSESETQIILHGDKSYKA